MPAPRLLRSSTSSERLKNYLKVLTFLKCFSEILSVNFYLRIPLHLMVNHFRNGNNIESIEIVRFG